MKRNTLDKLIGFFSPELEIKRIKSRVKTDLYLRSYDAAKKFATDDWTSATEGSANSEIKGAQKTLRDKGRDAIRNNPYALRALHGIAANTVGSGIVPNFRSSSSKILDLVNKAWKEWGETNKCDVSGRMNFYGIQTLTMKTVVESGEALILNVFSPEGPKLQLIESDHLNSEKDGINKDTGEINLQGIKIDKYNNVLGYHIYESHPGDGTNPKSIEFEKSKVNHIYRIDRPGQVRGVSWFHAVIRPLEDFNEYQQSTLISRKISACFSAVITSNDGDLPLSSDQIKQKRESESMMSPGVIRYLDNGEHIELVTPPAVQGYDEYCRQTLRSIASGLGITYEVLTSDYSQVNFSSGRMGNLEFRRNIEMWRWQMLIPMLCEPTFEQFKKYCELVKNIPVGDLTCEWVPPAWTMIDPANEIKSIQDQIRTGLTSWDKAVKEQGYDPDELRKEISESNRKLDELGIVLDSDPRRVTKAGITQVVVPGTNNGDSNK